MASTESREMIATRERGQMVGLSRPRSVLRKQRAWHSYIDVFTHVAKSVAAEEHSPVVKPI
ncbi:hypothetical protein HYALB_00009918 [Hymenoscyphus albidus]|uniref:Uncharacterized protein n=1 Tax=Hymenoscyphus albidus TaxID=595503 RepID=A0A9N9LUV1_9HELO|nr:hypothetical protein HYALB_00009918 [Hymenoscyphus albidus]